MCLPEQQKAHTRVRPYRPLCRAATLTPGYWIYVCPCGFQTSVARVDRTSHKWMVYCFKCNQQTGQYHKVMIERMDFTQNWNGKLNCQTFTSLRLHNPLKNCVGAVRQVYLQGHFKGNAKVLEVRRIHLSEINRFVARLDTGLEAEACRELIRTMYRQRPGIDWNTQLLDLCLLEYMKEEPKLF